jgi:hypothetical protein
MQICNMYNETLPDDAETVVLDLMNPVWTWSAALSPVGEGKARTKICAGLNSAGVRGTLACRRLDKRALVAESTTAPVVQRN